MDHLGEIPKLLAVAWVAVPKLLLLAVAWVAPLPAVAPMNNDDSEDKARDPTLVIVGYNAYLTSHIVKLFLLAHHVSDFLK